MIGWSCDFCKKSGLLVSAAGIIYCPNCHKSYGEQIELGLVKPEYIDHYGIDSLPSLIIASRTKADCFVTSNQAMLKDRDMLERIFKIKIRTPDELLNEKPGCEKD